MPTNRIKRKVKRRSSSNNAITRAIGEKLITGHWWPFLCSEEEYKIWGEQEPDIKLFEKYWNIYSTLIKKNYSNSWAERYFEGDYKEQLNNWQKWIKTDIDRLAVDQGCWFDYHAADRVVSFFSRFLRHFQGQWSGQPFTLLEWQSTKLVIPLYGWKRADGTRRYRQAYVEIPKKNGKSGLCSGFSLYHLMGDNEPGAQVYNAAVDREQTKAVYLVAEEMARNAPDLKRVLRIRPSQKEMKYLLNGSFYQALSKDTYNKEGMNISALVIDELHAHRTSNMFDVLRYGGASRRQPLHIYITTAGEERRGVCWEQHEYALSVLRGEKEDISFFPLIYCADPEKIVNSNKYWTLEKAWEEANPSLGKTKWKEVLQEECIEAQSSPRKEALFKRYHLNVWGESSSKFFRMDKWNECSGDGTYIPLTKLGDSKPELLGLDGAPCYVGLDLASRVDIAAKAKVFEPEKGYYVCDLDFFIPAENCKERSYRDRVDYENWAKEGWITRTEGNAIDYSTIYKSILEDDKKYEIKEVVVDPWNAQFLINLLQDYGLTLVEMPQRISHMNWPMKELEKLVLEGKLIHGGNPVLRWMAGNTVVWTDSNENIRPDKAHCPEKIDGIVALIMALSRACVHDDKKSMYETIGV